MILLYTPIYLLYLTFKKQKIKDKTLTPAILIANMTFIKILMVSENKTDKKPDIKTMRTHLYILFFHVIYKGWWKITHVPGTFFKPYFNT